MRVRALQTTILLDFVVTGLFVLGNVLFRDAFLRLRRDKLYWIRAPIAVYYASPMLRLEEYQGLRAGSSPS